MFWKKKEKVDKVILHGHDLSKWNYLGYNTASFNDGNGKDTAVCPVFFFASKTNDKKRSVYLLEDNAAYFRKYHTWVNTKLYPWQAGEGEIWDLISGKRSDPSDYLKDLMKEDHSCVWNSKKGWWDTNDNVQYDLAVEKQKDEKVKVEDNVVHVPFGTR